MVYVISKDGVPLMPTKRHGKIRHLLKEGKAKVVRHCPFTVKLLYGNACYTQELVLGIDMGSGTIGSAVSDTDGNILYMAKTIVRNDISGKMEQRAKYRRYRRNRKTRYRKPRFDNRANSKRKDRFSPTVTSKIQAHMREIRFVSSMLPVTKLVLETGNFDPHLMKRPDMDRHWGYQKGPNYGFASTKAMVLDRDSYTCQACSGRHKDPRLEVHHIIFRSKGGSDDADNLVTLCHTCHKALHAGRLQLNLNGKRKDKLKHATQMNTIRVQLLKLNPVPLRHTGM